MELFALELLKTLWAKSDPILILCVLALIVIQRRDRKAGKVTSDRLERHLNIDATDNPFPHPQCRAHDQSLVKIVDQLKSNRAETKADIELCRDRTREDIKDLSSRVEDVLKIAVKAIG